VKREACDDELRTEEDTRLFEMASVAGGYTEFLGDLIERQPQPTN
jgi:hypothetical protein